MDISVLEQLLLHFLTHLVLLQLADNGITTVASQWKAAHIMDGLSKTYFGGERFVYYGTYESGKAGDDDSGWDTDSTTIPFAGRKFLLRLTTQKATTQLPRIHNLVLHT